MVRRTPRRALPLDRINWHAAGPEPRFIPLGLRRVYAAQLYCPDTVAIFDPNEGAARGLAVRRAGTRYRQDAVRPTGLALRSSGSPAAGLGPRGALCGGRPAYPGRRSRASRVALLGGRLGRSPSRPVAGALPAAARTLGSGAFEHRRHGAFCRNSPCRDGHPHSSDVGVAGAHGPLVCPATPWVAPMFPGSPAPRDGGSGADLRARLLRAHGRLSARPRVGLVRRRPGRNGGVWPRLCSSRAHRHGRRLRPDPREYDVLVILAHGNSMARVQRNLVISEGTAITHRRNLYRKLGVAFKTGAHRLRAANRGARGVNDQGEGPAEGQRQRAAGSGETLVIEMYKPRLYKLKLYIPFC